MIAAANEYLERLADTDWLESTKTFATADMGDGARVATDYSHSL